MIYARKLSTGTRLIIAAADSLVELEMFYSSVTDEPSLYGTVSQPDIFEMMQEESYNKFKKPPYVFDFSDEVQLDAFVAYYEIELLREQELGSKHQDMIDDLVQDDYGPRFDGEERKSLEELHNLMENDPWDKRSQEQLEKDEQLKEEFEKAKAEGRLMGDHDPNLTNNSNAPVDNATPENGEAETTENSESLSGGQIKITDIRSYRDNQGNLQIPSIMAHKSSGPSSVMSSLAAAQNTTPDPNGNETEEGESPAQYLYVVESLHGKTYVALVEKDYWKNNGFVAWQTINLGSFLPDEMTYQDLGVFEYSASVDEANIMLAMGGFEESEEVKTWLHRLDHDDIVGWETLSNDPKDYSFTFDNHSVKFAPKIVDDPNSLDISFKHVLNLPDDFLENIENCFTWPSTMSEADIKIELEARGYTYDPDFFEVRATSMTLSTTMAAASVPSFDPSSVEELLQNLDENGVDMTVDATFEHLICYKLDVQNATIEDIELKLASDPNFILAIASRNTGTNCWFAFARYIEASRLSKSLVAAGFTVDTTDIGYGVKATGERLVPKSSGARVVDLSGEEEERPRPWNSRAPELATMTPEELEENKKTYAGREFIMSGGPLGNGKGCMVYIAPKTYFAEHEKLFDQPLDINHLLPYYFKEVEPGMYHVTQSDWNSLSEELNHKRGFKSNWWLQLYINNLE